MGKFRCQLRHKLRRRNVPLRVVLVVPFALQVMVAVGLTAYIAYRHGQDALNNLAHQLMVEVSDRVEDHLENYLEIPVQVTNENVNAIELGLLDWRNLPKLERYFGNRLENLSETKHELRSLLLVDAKQRLVVSKNQLPEDGAIDQKGPTQNDQLPRSKSLDEPEIINSVQPDTKPNLLQRKFWYQAAKQSSLGLWQVVAINQESAQPALIALYLKQFYDANDIAQGVVGASIDLSNISRYLSNLNISSRGQAFIVDSDGAFIATSTREALTVKPKNELEDSSFAVNPASINTHSRLAASQSVNSVTRDAADYLRNVYGQLSSISDKQQFSFELHGKSYFLQVTPLRNPKNLNWILVVAIPKSDFVAQLDRQYHNVLALSGLAMIGAIALGLATAQGIAIPILRLSRASRDLMLGKLDAPVNEQTCITELAVLAHSFNEMTDQLLQSFDQVKLALQESKEKFTTVFRTSPDPILVTTLPEGMILEANESFLRLIGISREEVIGKTAIGLGLWADLDDRKKMIHTIRETGRVYDQEVTTSTRYGTQITVLLSSERIELEGKSCLLTVAKDITERKRAEEALRISEARFRMAFDTAAIGMDIASPSGYFLQVNPALCLMLGYTEADLLKLTYRDITHPDDLQIDRDANLKIATGEVSSLSYEKRFIHRDGQVVWTFLSLTLIRDLQQQPLYWVAQMQNITARKQIESALQQSEARFRAVFDTASMGIAIADLEGNIVEANNTLCRICGFSKTELQATKLQAIIHSEDLPRWSRLVQELDSQRLDHYQLKTRCVRKDEEFIWTQLTAILIRDSNEQPLYLVARIESLPAAAKLESTSVPVL